MKKRFLSLAVAMALVLAFVPAAPMTASSYTEIVAPKYTYAYSFSDGMAAVLTGNWSTGKWGFIDKTGKEVIAPKYDSVGDFYNGLAAVMTGDWETGKWGFIDKTGKEVIESKYDYAGGFHEYNRAWVGRGGKHYFIDRTGKETEVSVYIDGEYTGLREMRDPETGKWGLVEGPSTALKVVVPYIYGKLHWLDGNLYAAGIGAHENDHWEFSGKVGIIDATGKEVVPLKYDDMGHYSYEGGLVSVKSDGKWGFIDLKGNVAVPIKYDSVHSYFSEGLVSVELNGKWGYVNRGGTEVIPCKYDNASMFNKGLAVVRNAEGHHFIDRVGKELLTVKGYSHVGYLSEGMAIVQNNSYQYGFISVTITLSPGMGNLAPTRAYYNNFGDIASLSYGQEWIERAYEYGLMDGSGADFNPRGNITNRDVIVVAAKIHAIYTTGSTDAIGPATNPYYTGYVDYAVKNGIVKDGEFGLTSSDFASRADVAYILGNSLPENEWPALNTYVSQSDVSTSHPRYESIKKFYETGITEGDGSGFNPGSNITRRDCAAFFAKVVNTAWRTQGKTFK